MKSWMRLCIAALAALWALTGTVCAADVSLPSDSLDTAALEEAAPDSLDGVGALKLSDLNTALQGLWQTVSGAFQSMLRASLRSGALLLVIVLLCTLAETVAAPAGGMSGQSVQLAGAAAVAMVALSDMNTLIGLGRETIQQLSDFTVLLIPTLTTAAVASGSAASAPVRQAATLLCSNLLTRLITLVLLPLTYVYAAGSVASAALGTPRLQPLCRLLRWVIVTALTVALLAYTGYLTMAGSVASAADAATVKAAQLAISGMIPVVGGILSDATETVFSGAALLRNSIGLFGVAGVLGFCAIPFLRLGLQFLLYKLVAALSATLSDHPVSGLIQELGNVFALVMGMTGACALVVLLSLVSVISAVMP